MGIFSSKKRIQVGTSVSRVLEDNALPDSLKTALMKGIFSGDTENDLVDYMLEEVANSIGVRSERMYDWARQHYVHGLPSGAIIAAQDGVAEIRALLQQQYGGEITFEYCHFGPPNNLHIAWQMITDLYGYNPETNRLPGIDASIGGVEAYLMDIENVIPYAQAVGLMPGETEQWGPSAKAGPTPNRQANPWALHTQYKVDLESDREYANIYYAMKSNKVIPEEGSVRLYLDGYLSSDEYFQVRFKVNGTTKFFTYKYGSGVYPTLDGVFRETYVAADANFYPLTHFRNKKMDMSIDKTSRFYKDSQEMLRHLGMDYGAIAEAINENPDVGDVQQATMMFAVPANTSNQEELRYLHSFFHKWWVALGQGYASPNAQNIQELLSDSGTYMGGRNAIVIQDALMKMFLSSQGIFFQKRAGSIGSVGFCSGEVSTRTENISYLDVMTGGTISIPATVRTQIFRKQVSFAVYEEVQIVGLQMIYEVEGDHRVLADEGDDILLIPIDRSLLEDWSMPDKEKLLSRSLHYVFNSLVEQTVKWYQQGWFSTFLIIVAVVITVLSYGSSWQTLAAALAAGTITFAALAYTIIVGLVEYLVTTYAVTYFVKAVGVEVAFIAALIAAMAGMYQAYQAGSLTAAPMAKELLQVSNALSKGVGNAQKGLMQDLLAEASEWEQYVKEQTKTLETAEELLGSSSVLAPFIVYGESSSDFFNRTVHAGNIGTVGISAVRSYVEVALKLPKLSQTIDMDEQYAIQ